MPSSSEPPVVNVNGAVTLRMSAPLCCKHCNRILKLPPLAARRFAQTAPRCGTAPRQRGAALDGELDGRSREALRPGSRMRAKAGHSLRAASRRRAPSRATVAVACAGPSDQPCIFLRVAIDCRCLDRERSRGAPSTVDELDASGPPSRSQPGASPGRVCRPRSSSRAALLSLRSGLSSDSAGKAPSSA